MKARILTITLVTAAALAGCTTFEKTATGTGVGAAAGALIGGTGSAALAGALIGGFGTFLVETADGKCQYRNSKGQVYTTKCHWK